MYPDIANEVNIVAMSFICTISNEVNITGKYNRVLSVRKNLAATKSNTTWPTSNRSIMKYNED